MILDSTISHDLPIENSSDLLYKINNINMENKSLPSLNIKSLYTNIHVKKCIKHLQIHILKK